MFVSTTGKPLDEKQGKALIGFIHGGGGYVGIHAGGRFALRLALVWASSSALSFFSTQPSRDADVKIEEPTDPGMSFLPNPWRRHDEWYDYKVSPRGSVEVLASLDNSSYTGSKMGNDHPIVWRQRIRRRVGVGTAAWGPARKSPITIHSSSKCSETESSGACGKSKRRP